MSFLQSIKSSIIGEEDDTYISRILEDRIKIKSFTVPDYLYVTDLINPVHSYFSRKYPDIAVPESVSSRMKYGEEVHFLARQWFEQIPGFSGSEVILTATHMGLNVVGRADFMIYDSIVEFKTKNVDRVNIENIYTVYRSALEQLLFYAAMNRNFTEDNFLVFFTGGKFHVYRVSVKDPAAVENEMVFRFSLIKRGIENGDISDFPRCSYFGYGCQFSEAGVCMCHSLRPGDPAWIKNVASISEDHEMESTLESLYSEDATNIDLRFYDLIYPRKYYHKITGDSRNSYSGASIPSSYYEKNNIKFFVIDSINGSVLSVSGSEISEINRVSTLPLYGDDKYIIKNIYDENSIIPYLLKINNSMYPGRFPDTYYSELAIMCARRNRKEGVLLTVYPRLGNIVVARDIHFDTEQIISMCNKSISEIRRAVETRNPDKLDLCPEFAIKSCDFSSCSCKKEIIKGREKNQ
jgi:hypothetical protein